MQLHQSPQIHWDVPCEVIVGEIQPLEVGAVADFWGNGAGEVVGSEGQGSESGEAGDLGRDRAGEVEKREVQERDPGLASPGSASDPGPATRAGVSVARIVGLSPIGSQVWATTRPGEQDRFVLAQSTIVIECQQLSSGSSLNPTRNPRCVQLHCAQKEAKKQKPSPTEVCNIVAMVTK